jgi:hypothetical protein
LHDVGLKIILQQLTFYRQYDSLDGKLLPRKFVICKTKQYNTI